MTKIIWMKMLGELAGKQLEATQLQIHINKQLLITTIN